MDPVDEWIGEDPERRAFVERLREARDRDRARSGDDDDVIDVDAEWRRMQARLGAYATEHGPAKVERVAVISQPRYRRAPSWYRVGAIAASLLVAATGIRLVWVRHEQQRTMARPQAMREYATALGQHGTFDLADGTHIVLAPGSRLRFPVDMTRGARNTVLEGQAYFNVAHDAARPFSVRTPDGVVRDVGTAFTVTAYHETRGTQVVVAQGSVALQRSMAVNQSLVTLLPGDMARLDTTGTVTLRRGVDVNPYLSWIHDTLSFVATPLREAAPAIGRWYDLDIRLADSAIGERHLEATLGDLPASAALKLIALSLDLRLEQRGRIVTFYPAHANP